MEGGGGGITQSLSKGMALWVSGFGGEGEHWVQGTGPRV